MQEFLNSIGESEWFIALISYLSANLGIIILFAIKMVKSKLQNNDLIAKLAKVEENTTAKLNDEFQAKLEALQQTLIDNLTEIDVKITTKLKLDKEETAKAIEEKQDAFNKAMEEIKASINIDLDDVTEDVPKEVKEDVLH